MSPQCCIGAPCQPIGSVKSEGGQDDVYRQRFTSIVPHWGLFHEAKPSEITFSGELCTSVPLCLFHVIINNIRQKSIKLIWKSYFIVLKSSILKILKAMKYGGGLFNRGVKYSLPWLSQWGCRIHHEIKDNMAVRLWRLQRAIWKANTKPKIWKGGVHEIQRRHERGGV